MELQFQRTAAFVILRFTQIVLLTITVSLIASSSTIRARCFNNIADDNFKSWGLLSGEGGHFEIKRPPSKPDNKGKTDDQKEPYSPGEEYVGRQPFGYQLLRMEFWDLQQVGGQYFALMATLLMLLFSSVFFILSLPFVKTEFSLLGILGLVRCGAGAVLMLAVTGLEGYYTTGKPWNEAWVKVKEAEQNMIDDKDGTCQMIVVGWLVATILAFLCACVFIAELILSVLTSLTAKKPKKAFTPPPYNPQVQVQVQSAPPPTQATQGTQQTGQAYSQDYPGQPGRVSQEYPMQQGPPPQTGQAQPQPGQSQEYHM